MGILSKNQKNATNKGLAMQGATIVDITAQWHNNAKAEPIVYCVVQNYISVAPY